MGYVTFEIDIHVTMFWDAGYRTQAQGRDQDYGNLGDVYLEMALKAMRFDETLRKSVAKE